MSVNSEGHSSSSRQEPATQAVLAFPKSIAVDSVGNLYIADAGSSAPEADVGAYSRVRKVSNGVITPIAGGGLLGFGGDHGPASAAELNVPQSVAVDGAGNVYVADSGSGALLSGGNALDLHLLDTGNNRIRVLTPNPAPAISPGGIVPNDSSVSVIQARSWNFDLWKLSRKRYVSLERRLPDIAGRHKRYDRREACLFVVCESDAD